MKTPSSMSRRIRRTLASLALVNLALLAVPAAAEKTATSKHGTKTVSYITSPEQFKTVVDTSGDHLLLFDLYADWCMPCRILSPMIEEIARENAGTVSVYKIDIDKQPGIAAAFGVRGIPYVVLVKNKTAVQAFTGVQPKGSYVRAIEQFSGPGNQATNDTPDGEIIEGIRVIHLSTATTPGDLYVYRGEEVKLIIENVEFPYSVSIPEYSVLKEGTVGKNLEVTFKATKTGVFSMFCNGDCPTGDGSRYGRIIVMDFKAGSNASFSELTPQQSKKFIEEKKPLVLDVRTPQEYHQGHLADATLIPLQQLDKRISEIAAYKKKDILLYCRSGNRSTVAAQILEREGFTKLHHVRSGIIGWQSAGYAVTQE